MIAQSATRADAPAIARIYNQGIEDRVATFETRLRAIADIEAWFDGAHLRVVLEDAGVVIAFASASTYRPRECYAGIAEVSAYVASLRMIESLGFRRVGIYGRHAQLDGEWRDVVIVEKLLTAPRS